MHVMWTTWVFQSQIYMLFVTFQKSVYFAIHSLLVVLPFSPSLIHHRGKISACWRSQFSPIGNYATWYMRELKLMYSWW